MAPRDDSPAGAGGPTNWVKSNLAAIGSVAVLTVYGVGFFKTKDAAARFAADAAARRPPRRHVNTGPQPGGTFTPARRGADAARATAPAAPPAGESTPVEIAPSPAPAAAPSTRSTSAPAASTKAVNPTAATSATPAASNSAASAAAHTATPKTVANATLAPTSTAAASSKTAHAAPAAATTVAAATASPPTTGSAAKSPAKATAKATAKAGTTAPNAALPTTPRPNAPATAATESAADDTAADDTGGPVVWKDGLFYGYGTSRHGDIQVAVEVLNHQILSVYITECLTQYSCSWIKNLPDEVVKIQSAETNYVSGATASSDAFYYAVVNALKKAR